MRALAIIGLAASALVSQAATAQSLLDHPGLLGLRIEGDIGGDRYRSERVRRDRLGYGGSGGFDGLIHEKIVIGAEGSYWRPDKGTENCTVPANGGTLCDKSFGEFGAAVRGGFLITPKLLIFGKGGYVLNAQRKAFNATANRFIVNGQIVGPQSSFYRRENASGYQLGGGAEYSLIKNFYVNAQYVFSQYDNHTYRQRVTGGIGFRF